MRRLADAESALDEQKREADVVEDALNSENATMRREYEQQIHFAEMMLADAAHKNEMLRRRVAQLEGCVVRLMANAPEPEAVKVPGEPEAGSAFGLTKTKEAIEDAVREAASLPPEDCRKKLNALRLKWHPDKHEVLREMAEEVTKIINEAIERMGTEESPNMIQA